MKDLLLELLKDFCSLAYDSWSSPESVATAIVSIITALSTAIAGIIAAFRSIDRKNGKDCCRFTGKKLNNDNKELNNNNNGNIKRE